MVLATEEQVSEVVTTQKESFEIPVGYRMTELGLTPEDWEINSIINLASITTGSKNTQDNVQDGKYPFFVRSSTVQKINTYSFDGEAVLTAGDGVGTGKVFHYINGKFDFHQRVYKISHFCENLHGYFFYLYFSNYFYNRIMQMTAKSSVDSVRREMIADMLIPLPPLSQQRAIAAALGDIDSLINSLDELIVKKRNIKLAAMQQLLTGKQRLPGFSDEWKIRRLEEIADIDPENLGKDTNPKYCFKYISLEDVDKGILRGYTEQIFYQAPSRARRKIRKNDILISTVRPNLKSHLLIQNDISNMICSTGFSVLRCKSAYADPAFIYAHFFASVIDRQIESLLTGSNYPAINSKDLRALIIPIPSLAEQKCIGEVLSDMDTELSILEHRCDKARKLKQGMMQELLTGRIRLK